MYIKIIQNSNHRKNINTNCLKLLNFFSILRKIRWLFEVCSKFPDFSLTGKCSASFPVDVETMWLNLVLLCINVLIFLIVKSLKIGPNTRSCNWGNTVHLLLTANLDNILAPVPTPKPITVRKLQCKYQK